MLLVLSCQSRLYQARKLLSLVRPSSSSNLCILDPNYKGKDHCGQSLLIDSVALA
jgi:hypothetical protein